MVLCKEKTSLLQQRDKDISVSDYTQQTNEDPVLGKLKGIISVAIERAS